MKATCFIICIFSVVQAQTAQLFYNEPVQAASDSVFEFVPKGEGLTTVSVSSSQPVLMFLRKDKIPSSSDFDEKSLDFLVLPALDPGSRYFLTVHPKTSFTLLLESPAMRNLTDSLPFNDFVEEASHHLYSFNPQNSSDIRVTLVYFAGKAELVVLDLEKNSTFHTENWEFGKVAKLKAGSYSKLRVSVIGQTNTDYSLTLDSGNEIWVKNGEISGLVEEHEMEFFTFEVDQDLALKIKLSVFSGECDMYLSVGSRPTIQKHDWAFTDHGSQIVELSPSDQNAHPGSRYVLGVHGTSSSAFVLSIQNVKVPIHRLSTGFPSIGSVNFQTFEYFSIILQENQEFSAFLSAGSGNPDLYGKFCNSSLKNCEFSLNDVKNPGSSIFYSNNTFGLEEIHSSGTGELIIGVFGASQSVSEFTIVAVLDDSEILLKSGTPQSATMTGKGFKFYKYKLAKWSASSVQFLLTPISGNPDLYISRRQKPGLDDYDASSVNSGLEVDSITFTKGKDYESLNGTYFIAVYSEGPSQYSIVAKENHPGGNTTVQLYPGLPQKDTFYSHCMKHRLYFFPIKFAEETKQPIRVSLTAITGKFLLAVTNDINHIDHERRIFYYHWSTDSANNQTANTIMIKTTDQFYLLKSTYAILVNTLEFGSDNTATYSIVLRIGDEIVLLSDNSPIVDLTTDEKYNFYTFPVTLSRENVHIKITAFSGNPEVFVALNHSSPNSSDYQFMAKGQNNYRIELEWTALKEKCPNLPDNYRHGNSTYCSLYIGVTSKAESSYSISVHANQLNYQLLLIPSTTLSVLSSEIRFYYGFPNITSDISIDCQLTIGDATLYVKLLSSVFQDISDVKFPTSEDNHFASQVYLIHSRRVKISHSDFTRLCGPKCLLAVTVVCGAEPCEFSLSLTQDNVVGLIEGENYLASVLKDSYVYFSYFCGREDQDFIISVTALDSGNPDVYVKQNADGLPSRTDWTWKAQTWEGEALVISRNDEYFNETRTIKGTYKIAVHGKTASNFQIRVRQNPQKVTKLVSGLPEYQVLNMSEYAYFYYKSTISSDIVIQVTPFSGKVVLYGKTHDPQLKELYDSLPSSSDYQFSSLSDISQFKMVIPQNSVDFCTSCNILIAVQCTTDCKFSIQASHSQKIFLLQNGVPVRGDLTKKTWNYYYFEVSTSSDLDFSLMTFSGDPDLFISTSPEVSFSDCKWSSISIKSFEHLTISRDDENYVKGGYYVGVYSNLQSSYAITAHVKNSFVQLISGLPSFYSLSPSNFMYFVFDHKSVVAQNIKCVLTPSDSQKPLVYVKKSAEIIYPGPKVFDFAYSSADFKDLYEGLYIKVKLEPEENLYISVAAGSEILNNFTIVCSGKDDATVLKLNKEMFDQIDSLSDMKMYEVNVERKGTLAVFIIPCAGLPLELRISSNWTMQHKGQPEFIVDRMTDGQLVAVVNNALGRYYIEVAHKSSSEDSFVITTYYSSSEQREVIVPGNYGKIDLDKSEDGVLLKWKSPVYENLTPYKDQVKYQIYLLDNLEHFSACSIMMSSESGKSHLIEETTKTSYLFKGKKKSFVNLIAVLQGSAKTFRFLPYDAVLVTPYKSSSTSVWIWFLLVGIIFVLLLLILIFRKTKAVQQRIDIEMTIGRDLPGRGQEKIQLKKEFN